MSVLSYYYKNPAAVYSLIRHLSVELSKNPPPVILCIGSDKITGDCLGPLTGMLLTKSYNINTFVYGTLSHPVTARNLNKTVSFIKARHPNSKILVIDAALGKPTDIGIIRLIRGGIYPGLGLGKSFRYVGNLSVTAVVASVKDNSFVRLGAVMDLAKILSYCIYNAFCLNTCAFNLPKQEYKHSLA